MDVQQARQTCTGTDGAHYEAWLVCSGEGLARLARELGRQLIERVSLLPESKLGEHEGRTSK